MFWKYCTWLAKCAAALIVLLVIGLAGGDADLGKLPRGPRRTAQDYPSYKPTRRIRRRER